MTNTPKPDKSAFATVVDTLEQQRAAGLHDGAQVYVHLDRHIALRSGGYGDGNVSAAACTWSQAKQSSRPPPSVIPYGAATTGTVAYFRRWVAFW